MNSQPPLDGLPHCPTCQDLRVVNVRLPRPDVEGRVNRLVPCPDCGELARRAHRQRVYPLLQARVERYSHRVGRACGQTFASFEQRQAEGAETESVRRAYQAALAFAERPRGWLLLHGSRGSGKSHLAAAVANHLAARPIDELPPLVLLMTTPALLDLLRSGFRLGDYDELLELVKTVDLLILDDLGVERASDWAEEMLFHILDHRYQAELPAMVVTNLRPERLEPRLQDRLLDDDLCVRVEVVAPTYRQRHSSPGKVL